MVFDTGDAEQKTLAVAMVDAGSGRVVRSHETAVVVDSAVDFGERSLSIDTAPYELARGVRAFGLRFTSAAGGPSCADGISRDELTLFVPDGTTLRPVLQGLAMTRMEARKNCFGPGMDVVYDEAGLSLGLAPAATNGFADIIVTAQIRRMTNAGGSDGKPKTERTTLRYDGGAYRHTGRQPWWLSFPASLH